MKVLVVSGSRADEGMLAWPIKTLQADPYFQVLIANIHGASLAAAMLHVEHRIRADKPDILLVLGDRFEILGAALAAHLSRIPIAHLCGGDVTEGSYDNEMRDCISRMASLHFATSTSAMARLSHMGMSNCHLVGSTGLDYIKNSDWKRGRPIKEPYCVVSYQTETSDGIIEFDRVTDAIPNGMFAVFIMPNKDWKHEEIRAGIMEYCREVKNTRWHESLPYPEFLNLIAHCDLFIGNSSSMIYEAPEMKVRTRMIGKRQRGRTIPWGDGQASQRIANILKYAAL